MWRCVTMVKCYLLARIRKLSPLALHSLWKPPLAVIIQTKRERG